MAFSYRACSLRCGTDARFECLLSVIRQRANILRPSQAEQRRSVAYRKIYDVILTGLSLRAGVRGKSGDEFAYRSWIKFPLVEAARKIVFFCPGSINAGQVRRHEDLVVHQRRGRCIDLGEGKGWMISIDGRDR